MTKVLDTYENLSSSYYVFDGFAGADKRYQLPLRVVTLKSWQGHFSHNMFIRPTKEELEGFEQCWLTGTAAEVTPVGQIGDYTFEVGTLTKDISDAYDKLVRS